MKQTLALIVVALMAAIGAVAQNNSINYTLKGIVADSLSHEGEPYATLTIVKPDAQDKPLKQALTDLEGRFSLNATAGAGQYLLLVRAVGRAPLQRTFTVSAQQRVIDLGELAIADAKNELQTVEVVAYKPLVKADIDKIAYSVEDDPEAQTNAVIEMLKKVPMVTVDGQDNIQVNGSSSFKVYVNGKPNNMMSKNPKEVFKSMPASNIKKIEVITNPGPKYDAEGVGAILNIITTGGGPEGYNATFTASVSNRHYGPGIYATMKQGKFTMSVNYNGSIMHSPDSYSLSERVQTDDSGAPLQQTNSENSTHMNNRWHGGEIEASYEIDTLRLVSASFSLSRYSSVNDNTGNTLSFLPATGQRLYAYNTLQRAYSAYNDVSGSIDYQRSFSVKDRLLTLSYRIENSVTPSDNRATYTDREATDEWAPFLNRIFDQRTTGHERSTEHTLQIDYTTPIAKIHTLEAGAKYILRQNQSIDDKYGLQSDGEAYDADNSSHYRHRNDIMAAYLGYALSTDKWSGRLGLRYEHTLQKVDYLLGRGSNFHKDFDDLVPSARIGYKLGDATNFSLGYKMRIYRPGIWFLNPYLNDQDPTNISQGNPNLTSEKSHDINLQFSDYRSKFNYTFTTSYRFVNNSIEQVSQLVNDRSITSLPNPTGKDVLYTTYANIGRMQGVVFSTFINWTPWQNTRFSYYLQGGYSHMTDGQTLRNHGWGAYLRGSIQQTIAKTWTLSLSGTKGTPQPSLQGKGDGFYNYSMSVSKTFMDKRLTLSAYASNPFNKYQKYRTDMAADNFRYTSFDKWPTRYVGVSVSYRIGKLRDGVKRANRTVENDDVKQGGQSGQGGH